MSEGNARVAEPSTYVRQEGIVDALKVQERTIPGVLRWVGKYPGYEARIEHIRGKALVRLSRDGKPVFGIGVGHYLVRQGERFWKVPSAVFRLWHEKAEPGGRDD